jgi:hypothetical protein
MSTVMLSNLQALIIVVRLDMYALFQFAAFHFREGICGVRCDAEFAGNTCYEELNIVNGGMGRGIYSLVLVGGALFLL